MANLFSKSLCEVFQQFGDTYTKSCLAVQTPDTLAEADYLDVADSFMGLRHADRLGWILIRQNLSAAQVVSSKDDAINKIFGLTGTRDCSAKTMDCQRKT